MSEEPTTATAVRDYDVARVRAEFPAFEAWSKGGPRAFLDNAATTQKPRAVVEALERSYVARYGAVARGVYRLSAEATADYEGARERVARFLGGAAEEVVFVRGTTEAINLVAASWGGANLGEGDEILVTGLEHHSNLVPWQLAAKRTGARLVVAPIDDRGELELEALERLLGSGRVRLVAVAHVSNALGTVLPVAEIVARAHAAGARVLLDAAQSVPRLPLDVRALGCDFLAFSGHKAYGPSGIGVLWARSELLEAMPPYQGGGGMIRTVSFEETTFEQPPRRFEAGTPAGPEAVGLGVALDWLDRLGRERVAAHEDRLLDRAVTRLAGIPGVRLIGTARERAGVVSFVLDGAHAHDVGTVLDAEGVAVRAGHHCAQPVMARFGVAATVRASFGVYNTEQEVDALADAVERARALLGR
ncbi:MAG TPA: cysteine desulfurase [Thermoanaerobaculia bacterium]|nr:cysteine desulfurase [Thermoanaerobaculia bacterium]